MPLQSFLGTQEGEGNTAGVRGAGRDHVVAATLGRVKAALDTASLHRKVMGAFVGGCVNICQSPNGR